MGRQNKTTDKLVWLAVLQGFGVLCVVIGHAWLTQVVDKNHPFVTSMIQWLYRFHMPLFFFISGLLFYRTRVIAVDRPCQAVVKDKAQRLLIPYVAFTVFAIGFKMLFAGSVNRTVQLDFSGLLHIILYPYDNPLQGLWFIATLFPMFLPVSAYRWLDSKENGLLALYVIALLAGLTFPFGIEFACISRIVIHLQFFALGMILASVVGRIFEWRISFLLFAVALTSDFFELGYSLVATSWILFFVSFFGVASQSIPSLFSSFRDFTFQIYLMSIFIQVPIRVVYSKVDDYYLPFFLLSVFAGVFIPVLVSQFISRHFSRVARLPFGL